MGRCRRSWAQHIGEVQQGWDAPLVSIPFRGGSKGGGRRVVAWGRIGRILGGGEGAWAPEVFGGVFAFGVRDEFGVEPGKFLELDLGFGEGAGVEKEDDGFLDPGKFVTVFFVEGDEAGDALPVLEEGEVGDDEVGGVGVSEGAAEAFDEALFGNGAGGLKGVELEGGEGGEYIIGIRLEGVLWRGKHGFVNESEAGFAAKFDITCSESVGADGVAFLWLANPFPDDIGFAAGSADA